MNLPFDIESLKSQSDWAFDAALQKKNMLEACRARQVMAYNNGIFFIDHSHIAFLHAMKLGNNEKVVMLDQNDNPISVDVTDFLEKSIERYNEALLSYHLQHETLKKLKQ